MRFAAHLTNAFPVATIEAETIEELDEKVCECFRAKGLRPETISYGLNDLSINDEFNMPVRTIDCQDLPKQS
jgi:hypothetical protein